MELGKLRGPVKIMITYPGDDIIRVPLLVVGRGEGVGAWPIIGEAEWIQTRSPLERTGAQRTVLNLAADSR